ncbi:MAG: hypothetical protein C4521_09935 [Actinobacteria bacterium]|nr:MAG: hypothetical protein C4521_09935 [Actinomycetota bacterium]
MSNYPYPETESYPDDAEHQQYLAEWNTRSVSEMSPFVASGDVHYSANTDLFRLTVDPGTGPSNLSPAAGWQSATGSAPTPGSAGSAVTSETLAKTNVQDGDYWITDLSTVDHRYNYQMTRFSVDPALRTSPSLKSMQLQWRGHGEPSAGYYTRLYLWNFQTSGWEQKAAGVIGTDVTWTWKEDESRAPFCLSCHDGAAPSGVTVPAGVKNINSGWAAEDRHGFGTGTGSGGSLKAPYVRGNAPIACLTCHDTHGSPNVYHFRETVNGGAVSAPTASGTASLCVTCHQGTVDDFHAGACWSCHDYLDHGAFRPNMTNCASCHKHSTHWTHPSTGCHGCQDPSGQDFGPSF